MFIDQLFEPNQMEMNLVPWDLYKGVTEDSMTHHQLPSPNRDRVTAFGRSRGLLI